jgi:hypothetical protein
MVASLPEQLRGRAAWDRRNPRHGVSDFRTASSRIGNGGRALDGPLVGDRQGLGRPVPFRPEQVREWVSGRGAIKVLPAGRPQRTEPPLGCSDPDVAIRM